MKRLTILAILILTAAAFAVPQYLTYQGVLRDSTGALVTGTKSMSFGIFNASTGGTAVYSSGTLSVSVSNGNYTVQLGPVNSTTIFNDTADKYLEVTMDSLPLSPRLKINSVGYAIRAEVATSADSATTATTATNATFATTAGSANSIADYLVTTNKIGTAEITGAKLATNIAISTTGNIAANTLTVTKIATQGAGCVGTGRISSGNIAANVVNPNVTANSKIFVMPATQASTTYEALTVIGKNPPTDFDVGFTLAGAKAPENIDFYYLIIN